MAWALPVPTVEQKLVLPVPIAEQERALPVPIAEQKLVLGRLELLVIEMQMPLFDFPCFFVCRRTDR